MSAARRLALGSLVWLCVLVGLLVVCGASAFAAAPEAPLVEVSSRLATEIGLRGVLYPNGAGEPGSYEFLYKQSASECEGGERSPAGVATGNQGEEIFETLSGLQPGRQYTVCLAVSNGSETTLSAPLTVTTMPAAAPIVEEASVNHVSADSATLAAKINPRGAETSYTFEYAPAGGAFAPVPGAEGKGIIPEGSKGVPVSVHVQGLLAHTPYQFRVVAANSVETVTGTPVSFTTQTLGVASGLADGRDWEMVSPPQKEGVLLGWIAESPVQASTDGNAFTDWSLFEPIEAKAAGDYDFYSTSFFGRGRDGWVSKTIAPPHSAAGAPTIGLGGEYRFFSEDLSKAIVQPFGPVTPLAPGVSESTPYVHTDYVNGNSSELCGSGCYEPLVSEANVPAGTKYGVTENAEENGLCVGLCGPRVSGVSRDLSHVVLSSLVGLTAGSSGGLYEWGSGKLAFLGSGSLASPESGGELVRQAISDDGSRVFIEGSYEGVAGLLLRDTATGETIRLDVPQGNLPPVPPGQAIFQTASADGSRVFFTSGQPLTEDAREPALYEYDLNAATGSRLTDLTVDENADERAGVQAVLGASEDGSYVYFAATGVLAPGASPATCGGATPVCSDLYVRHDGRTTFIAGLSGEDYPDWAPVPGSTGFTARVSPNGQWLAFMSNRDLTGYDTTDAVSGRPDEEVYLYGASAGKLVCASCNPTGARPVGVEYHAIQSRIVGGEYGFAHETWIASNVPAWTKYELEGASYQSRYLSDSGRLFFNSHDALVPQDVNGAQDVYEYEPSGTGDCDSSRVTFSETSGGCVSLVSSGESSDESGFLDASETGGDVFFLTSSKLVAQDFDNTYDIYDARECGTGGSRCFAQAPVSAPPCSTGDSCKPAPSPQPAIFASPASATFNGAGNITPATGPPAVKPRALTRAQRLARALKACHSKKGKKRRGACERQAHGRYGTAAKSGRTNASGRGGR